MAAAPWGQEAQAGGPASSPSLPCSEGWLECSRFALGLTSWPVMSSLRKAMENYFGVLTWRDVYEDMLEDIIAEDEAEREGWDGYEDRIHASERG